MLLRERFKINTAQWVKQGICFFYFFSPYFWVDSWLKSKEKSFPVASVEQQYWREIRLMVSEWYILGWLLFGIGLYLLSMGRALPVWLVIPLLLRIFGILNKEFGVILFGVCKITEGRMVSATGRVIVLAFVNFFAAMILFATVYQIRGHFLNLPDFLQDSPFLALYQSAMVQFTMNTAFEAADAFTWLLSLSQSVFAFLFGTIVISLFVSLLSVKPINS